jgi:hypothetical protein
MDIVFVLDQGMNPSDVLVFALAEMDHLSVAAYIEAGLLTGITSSRPFGRLSGMRWSGIPGVWWNHHPGRSRTVASSSISTVLSSSAAGVSGLLGRRNWLRHRLRRQIRKDLRGWRRLTWRNYISVHLDLGFLLHLLHLMSDLFLLTVSFLFLAFLER